MPERHLPGESREQVEPDSTDRRDRGEGKDGEPEVLDDEWCRDQDHRKQGEPDPVGAVPEQRDLLVVARM